jgi:hypothetical protein
MILGPSMDLDALQAMEILDRVEAFVEAVPELDARAA